ncbi:uncharacterized protein LOC113005700 isoform X2 [Solenopsis invicta]|nr:uncharacterized protein LOC113005700 isoform X2 [Solenopsis invicta]
MSLQPHLQYDQINDKIIGFEDWGNKRTQGIANHALVFMLRVRKAGFTIIATICDQGASNVSALKQLLNDTRSNCLRTGKQYDDTITLDGQKIIILYDPPHLLKGIRNNFLQRDIEVNDNKSNMKEIATWNVIETAYELDMTTNTLNRQLRKLTDLHIKQNRIKKMKVKLAAQVFSATLSAFIAYNSRIDGYINTSIGQSLKIPREEGFATAKILDFFNKLFDSVNAHEIKSNTPLRIAVTKNSAHHSVCCY